MATAGVPVFVSHNLGLVHTECSSGSIRSQGGVTNAGNSHARQR